MNSHGRDILSLTGVLGKITIKEYTYTKKTNKHSLFHYQASVQCELYFIPRAAAAAAAAAWLQTTDQKEEAGAGQPEVPSSVTVDVEVLSGQVTVWVQDLKCALEQCLIHFNYMQNN